MSKIIWDAIGERTFETGVTQGVLYPRIADGTYPLGVAWNGLTGVTESPTGAEPTPMYADNIKYLNLLSVEAFGATIEAYTYPDEFGACDGSASPATGISIGQQKRDTFGMCYKTAVGNDVDGSDHAYKLHLIYGATASPSEKAYASINETPEAITFSWEITTIPLPVAGFKPTASLVIDSRTTDPTKLAALELLLYGDTAVDPVLLTPNEVVAIIDAV